jgi:hypothetical protein
MPTPPIATLLRVGPTSSLPARTFSEYAEAKMWDLLKDEQNQVGTKYTGPAAAAVGKVRTDCITYVMNVLSYAFEQTGRSDIATGVRSNSKKGTKLAQYLVSQGWNAYYWNPDVRNPRDRRSEHVVSYQNTKRHGAYYTVPVKGFIIDYNLTPVAPRGFLEKLYKEERIADMTAFNALSKIKFGYLVLKGGDHTALFSYGMVFEVHWGGCGKGLYERQPFFGYPPTTLPWLSGVVVLPTDSGFSG